MNFTENDYITIINANENNLKNVSVKIPKKKITVFTGISGSGKSSLCLDTLAAESRRELNETFPSYVQQYLPKYGRPDVERIENLPVTIALDQKKPAANSRSTVGTYTDIYALLRLLFSRVGEPFAGYSDSFSFNHPAGKCQRCSGLGEIKELDIHKLVDFNKCLNDEGVINFPAFTTGAWRWKRYAYTGLFDLDKKIKNYTKEELDLFLYSPQIKLQNPPPHWPKTAKYEGIYPRMYRSIIHTNEGKLRKDKLDAVVQSALCPDCKGTRLSEKIRSCKIHGLNIAEVSDLPIPDTLLFVDGIEHPLAGDLKKELHKRLKALVDIGLGYLSLSRGISTLSGGEAQRIKIAKYINSALTDIVYVLDEPSAGLHSHDIERIKESLMRLNKGGNTILIIEHHREIIEMADYIIDMGPGAGVHGGEIIFAGSYEELLNTDQLTSRLLRHTSPLKKSLRIPTDWFHIEEANLHNLKNLSMRLPLGVLAVVAGVAGSGKSSLMTFFQKNYPKEVILIEQKDIGINNRSTPATYLNILDDIRKIFAKANQVDSAFFSFNSKGACPACGGKGIILSDMSFMDTIETLCDLCHGKRFSAEVLQYTYKGKNIAEVMDLSIEEAFEFFKGESLTTKLSTLEKVGLYYLHLNQSMTTLSGGELQRIKLASHLSSKGSVFVIDEPTSGLHLDDTFKLMTLFNEIVDAGNSVFLVEHSLDVMKEADYIIELGPSGGLAGGHLLFEGTPEDLLNSADSITRPFLLQRL